MSIAALVVSIANLAWTIYNDIKKPGGQANPDALSRRIRITLRPIGNLDESKRDRIIDVIVEETLKQRHNS